MPRWVWWLTGGRPMRQITLLFQDRVVDKPVFLFEDRLGRRWMAHNRWSVFRSPYVKDRYPNSFRQF